ncbi:MAG: host-nuclease inhibitor Gam family protein [Flavipsychrobacter sp.]
MATKKITEEQFEEAQKQVVQSLQELATIDAKKQKDVSRIAKKYQAKIAEAENAHIEANAVIQEYCLQNDKVLFTDGSKSSTTLHGTVSKRALPPSLVLADGVANWDAVIANIEKAKKHKEYLIIKKSVNKTALMSIRANKGSVALFKKLGVGVSSGMSKYSFKALEAK